MLTLRLAQPDGTYRVVEARTTAEAFPEVAAWAAERGLTSDRPLCLHDLEVVLSRKVKPSSYQARFKGLITATRTPHRTIGGRLYTLPQLLEMKQLKRSAPTATA